MTITEFFRLVLKPDVKFEHGTPEAEQFAQALFGRALARPGAAQRATWAIEVENPSHVWGFMEWESLEAHEAWLNDPDHAVEYIALEKFTAAPIASGSGGDDFTFSNKHVSAALSDPTSSRGVVECLTAYFPADVLSDADEADVTRRAAEFVEKSLVASNCSDFLGSCYGWAVERDFVLPGASGDASSSSSSSSACRCFVMFIGWPSVEAHMRFRDTEAFREHIGLMRGMPGLAKMGMAHLRCAEVTV